MAERISKKEQILMSAMKIFSDKGYDATTIDEIGASVKLKGPALYYYFKSKEDLLQELVNMIQEQYMARFSLGLAKEYYPRTLKELTDKSRERVWIAITDDKIRTMRMFLTKEQFRLPEIGRLLTQYSIFSIIHYNKQIFAYLQEIGEMKACDPYLVAFEYSTPFTILMQINDRNENIREEVLEGFEAHIAYFLNLYGPQKNEE